MTTNPSGERGGERRKVNQSELLDLVASMERLGLQRYDVPLPEGRRVGPTVRLNKIVHALLRYGELLGGHLMTMFYQNLSPTARRPRYYQETRLLLDEEWLCAAPYPGSGDRIHWPGRRARVLHALDGRQRTEHRQLLWPHSVLVADIMTSLIVHARTLGGRCEWIGDYEGQVAAYLRPDATAILELPTATFTAFVEADTGSEDEQVIGEKYDRYLSYYHEGTWRSRFESYPPIVMITKGGEDRLRNMVAAVAERMQAGGLALHWFVTTENRLLSAEAASILTAHVWQQPFKSEPTLVWQPPRLAVSVQPTSSSRPARSGQPPTQLTASQPKKKPNRS